MKAKLLLAAGIFMFSGLANAADSVDLKVSGKLAMGSCNISLDDNVLNVGHIPVKNLTLLQGDNSYQTSHYKTNLLLECSEALPVAFTVTDNHPNTAISTAVLVGKYGLGKTEAGDNIGVLFLFANKDTSQVNGTEGEVIYSTNSGGGWSKGTTGLTTGATNYYSIAKKGEATPEPVTTATMPLDIQLEFSKPVADALTEEQNFDGSMTFTLHYI